MGIDRALDFTQDMQKMSFLLLLLPLISFIYFEQSFWLILAYAVLFTIHALYIHLLISFKGQVTREVVFQNKNKYPAFWYVPYLWLFAFLTITNLVAFFYSFALSILYFNSQEMLNLILLLGHVMVFTLSIFILLFIGDLSKKIKKYGIKPEDG